MQWMITITFDKYPKLVMIVRTKKKERQELMLVSIGGQWNISTYTYSVNYYNIKETWTTCTHSNKKKSNCNLGHLQSKS